MHTRLAALLAVGVLAGCSAPSDAPTSSSSRAAIDDRVETTRDAVSTAPTLNAYKRDLAQRIAEVNSIKVFVGRPQALLRSVVVIKYVVDANGKLVRSEIMRSNHDRETEATAMATLRNTAPFPKPAPQLLHRGHIEIMETWLFNNDGRFQLRTIAESQMDS